MRRVAGVWMVVAGLLVASPAPAQRMKTKAGVRVENALRGISLVPPAGWRVVSKVRLRHNRQQVRLSDAELQESLRRLQTGPIFAYAKFKEPHPTVNPTLQVTVRALIDMSGPSSGPDVAEEEFAAALASRAFRE